MTTRFVGNPASPWVTAGLSIALLCGCAARAKGPLQPPNSAVSLTHYTGSPLSGPTTRMADTSQPDALISANVRLIALEKDLPSDLLRPIDPDVRLIVVNRGGEPVVPVMRLARGTRWASGDDAAALETMLSSGEAGKEPAIGRSALISAMDLVVPPGATATVRAIDEPTAASAEPRGVELSFYAEPAPADHQLQLALAIEDRTELPESDDSAKSAGSSAGPQYVRELAILRTTAVAQPQMIALAVPFKYSDGRTRTVLMLINATPGAGEGDMAQLAMSRSTADLAASASDAARRPAVVAFAAAAWPGYEAALRAIDEPVSRRPSLAYLASDTGATICEDCLLVADDPSLEKLSQQVRGHVASAAATTQPTRESLGWALDSAALSLMAQMQSDSKLPSELMSVMLRQTGQAGANVGLVQDLLTKSKSRSEFETRVQAENFVALEDNAPGARVRAFDWLVARGKGPEGYDPLAPTRQRRAALDKAFDAMAAATTAPSSAPSSTQPSAAPTTQPTSAPAFSATGGATP